MRDLIRKILFKLNIPLTENLHNDILLKKIIQKVIQPTDSAIDIGAHKGEILDLFCYYAPNGKHFAFEPIPYFYDKLRRQFKNVAIYPFALSNETGEKDFFWIKNHPAYSGLNKRKFSENTSTEKITVQVKQLQEIIPTTTRIKFIKIDVEGAEILVLKGAENILKINKPYIVFEFGLGGSDYYQTTADDMYEYLSGMQYKLYSFDNFLAHSAPYTKETFNKVYQDNSVYNFIAVPE